MLENLQVLQFVKPHQTIHSKANVVVNVVAKGISSQLIQSAWISSFIKGKLNKHHQ